LQANTVHKKICFILKSKIKQNTKYFGQQIYQYVKLTIFFLIKMHKTRNFVISRKRKYMDKQVKVIINSITHPNMLL